MDGKEIFWLAHVDMSTILNGEVHTKLFLSKPLSDVVPTSTARMLIQGYASKTPEGEALGFSQNEGAIVYDYIANAILTHYGPHNLKRIIVGPYIAQEARFCMIASWEKCTEPGVCALRVSMADVRTIQKCMGNVAGNLLGYLARRFAKNELPSYQMIDL
jgi:hypothetical protein